MSLNNKRRQMAQLPKKLYDYQHPEDKPGRGESLRREDERQALVEQRIQEAMADGEFDNLPGAGKPFKFNQNPYLEPGQEWAFGLLKRNGLAPEWIERGRAIRVELTEARGQLQTAWQQYRQNPTHYEAYWQRIVAQFAKRLAGLNRKIDDYNLVVPVVSAQHPRLSLDAELRRLKEIDPR